MITNFDKILNELSYRVKDGTPDLTNEQHLIKLYDILQECQWPIDARIELIKTLAEARMVPNPNPSPNKKKKMVTLAYAKTFYKDKGIDVDNMSDDEARAEIDKKYDQAIEYYTKVINFAPSFDNDYWRIFRRSRLHQCDAWFHNRYGWMDLHLI